MEFLLAVAFVREFRLTVERNPNFNWNVDSEGVFWLIFLQLLSGAPTCRGVYVVFRSIFKRDPNVQGIRLQISRKFQTKSVGQLDRHYFFEFPGNATNGGQKTIPEGGPEKSSGICGPGWGWPGWSVIDNVNNWPGTSPSGGRDSGRLSSSVRTCLAEAATAADSKGGGSSPP